MAAVGSLLFCTACGELLDGSTGDPKHILICDVCGTRNKDIEYKPVISTSKPGAFPSELRAKRSNVQANDEVLKEASIERTCPNCSNPEMLYHTKQLRSADEGTTVFYTCPKCGFKEVTNN